MFALRRAPRRLATSLLVRGNATTVTSAPAGDPAPPPPPPPKAEVKPSPKTSSASSAQPERAEEGQKEAETPADAVNKSTRKYDTKRPRIDAEHPRQWSRPLAVGVLPAYDEALEYIKRDSQKQKSILEQYRVELAEAESAKKVNRALVEKLKEKVHILEIQSEINLPSVRWKARNALGMCVAVWECLIQ